MVDERALETELQAVGRRLGAAMPVTRNPLKAFDEKAMDLASADAELKAALFRFVDVVPACRNLDDLARHLTGFLGEVERASRRRSASRCGWATRRPAARALGAAAAAGVQAHGAPLHRRRGPEGGAAACCADLWKDGVASSVDLLGEATVTQAEAAALRRPLRRRARHARRRPRARWPERPQLERDSAGAAPAREPVGEGVRADAAAAAGRAGARQARRRRPAARRCCGRRTSSAPTCTSTWSRWTRATRCSS